MTLDHTVFVLAPSVVVIENPNNNQKKKKKKKQRLRRAKANTILSHNRRSITVRKSSQDLQT